MPKIEYKVIDIKIEKNSKAEELEKELNKLGDENWDLFEKEAIEFCGEERTHRLILKREKK